MKLRAELLVKINGHYCVRNYRAEKKSLQILLSSTQAGPGRKVKQEREEISRNHVPRLFLSSVHVRRKGRFNAAQRGPGSPHLQRSKLISVSTQSLVSQPSNSLRSRIRRRGHVPHAQSDRAHCSDVLLKLSEG